MLHGKALCLTMLAAVLVAGPVLAATTTRVSVATDGTEGNGDSSWASLSANGRYVAFASSASNLVAGDTNGRTDVFVRDRQTGETTRVSVSSDGTQADGDSYGTSISADGRYVVFESWATNLVSGATPSRLRVFRHDRQTGETIAVSAALDGTPAADDVSGEAAVGANGRWVVFWSRAGNLVAADTNGHSDVFVRDCQTGLTIRVSVASDGAQGNDESGLYSAISGDGRYVAFESSATNLVAGDTNGVPDVFLHDCLTGETTRVSVGPGGTQANGSSSSAYLTGHVSISADGRYVGFSSEADNLVSGDTNGLRDSFVYNRQTGLVTRVSVASDGTQANAASDPPFVSGQGRYAILTSYADNLVAGDTNGVEDAFLHDCQTGETQRVSVATDGGQALTSGCFGSSVSTDGRYALFTSRGNLVAEDTNGATDVFVRDRIGEECFYGSLNTRGKAPLQVSFTYLPTGSATAWSWEFGDGDTSTETNPAHTYLRPGKYSVTVTVTGAGGPVVTTKEAYITVSFPDVPIVPEDAADHWALQQILGCVASGIVGGYPEGTYGPAIVVTRDQMAAFIARALAGGDSWVPTGPPTPTFPDVLATGPEAWAYKYVEFCVGQRIVGGYPDGKYWPLIQLDRGQMAVFIARATVPWEERPGLTGYSEPMFPSFPDVLPVGGTAWMFREVEYIHELGIVNGYPEDGRYHPEILVSRDQMAVFISRAFGYGIL